MESSLRYGGDSKSLRIHAKEKYPIAADSNTQLQLHGELDTRIGAPSYLSAMIRHFYPDVSASIGAGIQYTRHEKLRYSVRGKKTIPVTDNGLINFNIKGRMIIDKEFKEVGVSFLLQFVSICETINAHSFLHKHKHNNILGPSFFNLHE
ncbi:Hypothetical predicted protein [Olea europaea subsp. europaea]|uniref:Uncharacterized protein n=1 Tax=Olea europaea subsp. europaea TaxID=158383 RepID=A0A8S0T4M9_OLEEU|nr:Hypothetical predicted protein [Olea europaea subsp. europaea]